MTNLTNADAWESEEGEVLGVAALKIELRLPLGGRIPLCELCQALPVFEVPISICALTQPPPSKPYGKHAGEWPARWKTGANTPINEAKAYV